MRRVFALFIICSLAIGSLAQPQHGFVKTLGRPEKKGVALSGVSVRVKGEHNAVLSKDDGTFSIMMTGKKVGDAYLLQQVQKTGYELNEQGVIGRQYAYSDRVPLTIVMVSKSQLQTDKQRIENNAYQVAEKNYKIKLALLEKQKEENAIAIEEYRQQLQALQDGFEKYQSLIDGLAEHFAHVDYDNLDEKEREINLCIENGDLERADSLIHTFFDPVDVLKRNKDALAKIEQQETQARDILAQANADMAAVLKQQEKDAEYLYQLYTIALAKFDNEKALFYIETRAELDTTNVEWQMDAGSALGNAADYEKAMMYNNRALQCTEKNQKNHYLHGAVLSNIGNILQIQAKYLDALAYFEQARDFDINIWGGENVALVRVYNNIGHVYHEMEQYKKALENYDKAYAIEINRNPTGSMDIALLNNNLAGLYSNLGKKEKAIELLGESLELYKRFCGEQSVEVASVYGNLADQYAEVDALQSLKYVQMALDIYSKLYGENHPKVAWCYVIEGSSLYLLGEEQSAEDYCGKALAIFQYFYGESHPRIADIYALMGVKQIEKKDYFKALSYIEKAKDIYTTAYGVSHSKVASCFNNIGLVQMAQNNLHEASVNIDKAVSIMDEKYPEGHPDLYTYYLSQGSYRMGLFNADSQKFAHGQISIQQLNDYGAEESFDKMLATAETFFPDDSGKIETAIGFLVNLYFIKYALGYSAYGQKIKTLSTKFPTYVKQALDNL